MIKKMKNIGMYAFLILVTFISVFPLYWMVSASTNKSVDVSKGVLSFGSHLGENLKNLLANQDVGAALVNSFKYAILLTIVSMVICSLAGYGFEIYHDKAKDAVMGVILLAMIRLNSNPVFISSPAILIVSGDVEEYWNTPVSWIMPV